MLCPEVWRFAVSRNSINIKEGTFKAGKNSIVEKFVNSHPFNEMISILLPDEITIPDEIISIIRDSDHYMVKNFRLDTLIKRHFIEGFIKRGKFTALSCATDCQRPCLDIDDRFAVTPAGKLFIVVNRDLYQTLGLEGKPSLSCISDKQPTRYVIQIDLKHPDLIDGKNYFERIKRSLSHELLTGFSMKFTWEPPDDTHTICTSSACKYFSGLGFDVELIQTKVKSYREYVAKVPRRVPLNDSNDDDAVHNFIEQVSVALLSENCETSELVGILDNHADENALTAQILHIRGLFSCQLINKLVEQLKINKTWTAICVQGPTTAPLAFANQEHLFSSNGDNNYTLFLTRINQFLLYQNSATRKSVKP